MPALAIPPQGKSGLFKVQEDMMDPMQPEAHEQLPCWCHLSPPSPAAGRRDTKGEQRGVQQPDQPTAALEKSI